MMRNLSEATLVIAGTLLCGAMVSPDMTYAQTDVEELGRRHGATPPAGYYEMLRAMPRAFQFSAANGWVRRSRAVAAVRSRARARAVALRRSDATGARALLAAEAQASEAVVAGDLNLPVFLIMYANTDSAALAQNVPSEVLASRIFGSDPAPPYSVPSYYLELSNGLLRVNGTVLPWTRVPETSLHYAGNSNGLDITGDIPGLIDAIVAAHDDTLDFGRFDNDGPDGIPNSGDDDGYVDAIVMFHAQLDGSCKNKNPAAENAIWAHRFQRSSWGDADGPFVTNDSSLGPVPNILIDDYIIQGGQGGDEGCTSDEPQAMGVVAHELGHLFGLPDLYDNTSGGSGIGRWGLMGSGNWRLPYMPAHMSAWSKAQLGWVTEVVIDRDTTLEVAPVITSDTSYTVPVANTSEYFILENRQPLGSDSALYKEGLLVWHADTFLLNQRGNWVNSFRPYALALVQADGRDDLIEGTNKGDAGDPFPGLENNTTLGVCTDPASDTNYNGPSLVVLDSITQLGPMGAIRVGVSFYQPDPVLVDDQSFEGRRMGESFSHQFTAAGGLDCDRRWSLVDGRLPNGLLLQDNGLLWGRFEEAGQFTARVQVASGELTDTATVNMSVTVPVLSVDDVVRQLLTGTTLLSFFEVTYLDLQGNRNGEFDLGDFLGWIESTGAAVSAAEMAEVLRAAEIRGARPEVKP